MNNIEIENQPILSRIFTNINLNNQNSNAYILYGNDSDDLSNYSIILSKILICPKTYDSNCNNCNICYRISENIYNELIIINKDNEIIKKEDILKIREKFKTEPLEGKNNVYIINNIENMNDSAANALLKFLEEPDGHDVAIFTTTNLNKVMKTILSRCQVLKINNKIITDSRKKLEKTVNLMYDDILFALKYFITIENNYSLALSELKEQILKKYIKKDQIKSFMMVGILLYKDMINYKLFKKLEFFDEDSSIVEISEKQNIDKLSKKISFLLKKMDDLDYNVNITLYMVNVLIGLGELNNDGCSRN